MKGAFFALGLGSRYLLYRTVWVDSRWVAAIEISRASKPAAISRTGRDSELIGVKNLQLDGVISCSTLCEFRCSWSWLVCACPCPRMTSRYDPECCMRPTYSARFSPHFQDRIYHSGLGNRPETSQGLLSTSGCPHRPEDATWYLP